MRFRASVLLLAVAALGSAGCRSDGGFDRSERHLDFAFFVNSMTKRTEEDAQATARHVSCAPQAFVDSLEESRKALNRTYHLYLEAHQTE